MGLVVNRPQELNLAKDSTTAPEADLLAAKQACRSTSAGRCRPIAVLSCTLHRAEVPGHGRPGRRVAVLTSQDVLFAIVDGGPAPRAAAISRERGVGSAQAAAATARMDFHGSRGGW